MFVFDNKNILIELIADNVYLVRGYREGSKFPDPSSWVVTVVVKGDTWYPMGMVSTGEIKLIGVREIHKYFKSLGLLKINYYRDKGHGQLYNIQRNMNA